MSFLLTVKNLQEFGGSPFPYIIPVIPRWLPDEVIEGKHFVFLDLLKLVRAAHLKRSLFKRAKRRLLQGP